MQASLIAYLEAVLPAEAVIFAVPNAARREKGKRAGNAVPGLKPGIPDIGIILPGPLFLMIESKREIGGRLSQDQSDIIAKLNHLEVPNAVARSIEDVRLFLRSIGVKTREAAPWW